MAKKYDVWATRPTRYNGERVEPGTKLTVDESEMPGLMSSGRFTNDEDKAPEPSKKAKKEEPPKS
jgi:hypothetical protein